MTTSRVPGLSPVEVEVGKLDQDLVEKKDKVSKQLEKGKTRGKVFQCEHVNRITCSRHFKHEVKGFRHAAQTLVSGKQKKCSSFPFADYKGTERCSTAGPFP